jgi:hypothetical protein
MTAAAHNKIEQYSFNAKVNFNLLLPNRRMNSWSDLFAEYVAFSLGTIYLAKKPAASPFSPAQWQS